MQGARNLRVKPKHELDSDLFDNTTLGPKGNSQKTPKIILTYFRKSLK